MAGPSAIRFPESGAPFTQFVGNAPDKQDALAFYPTYAHLIVAAAALGTRRT